jgi:hypothetical protein
MKRLKKTGKRERRSQVNSPLSKALFSLFLPAKAPERYGQAMAGIRAAMTSRK